MVDNSKVVDNTMVKDDTFVVDDTYVVDNIILMGNTIVEDDSKGDGQYHVSSFSFMIVSLFLHQHRNFLLISAVLSPLAE